MSVDFHTIDMIIRAARENLDQGTWDYLVGGSESETTLRRNRAAFDRIAFRPRVLVDVSHINTSTALLGHRLRIPALVAPIGSLHIITPDGGAAAVRGALEFGTVPVVSTVTEPSLEDIAASAEGPKIFQLYVRGDWEWVTDLIGRVKAAGYDALVLTVDTAMSSRRERPLHSWGYTTPTASYRSATTMNYQASLTWDKMDRIRELAGLPFILKGVQTAEDAALAVEHGVDVIWVSNHGGRQLDHGRGSLTTLPEIVAAVNGRVRIVVDGGIQRGSDIVKAIALGADAVAIGRLEGWGLAAAGKDGLVRVLEILETEMISAMGLLGVTSLAELGPQYLCEADPVTPPHEMSSWVNMPDGRLL